MKGTTEQMAITGGGYALAGFVYQLLSSLDFATSVAVARHRDPQTSNDTFTVTIEPPSGGDATHKAGADKATIQFKTRRRGNFTERDVLVEVFPDLFKAARTDADQAFVLRTDAPVKLTPAFKRLTELLGSHPIEAGLDQAEAEGLRFKAHQAKGTRSGREHFDWLLGVVSPESRTKHDRQSLADLISRFRVEDEVDEKGVFDRVMQGLRQLAGTHEDAHQLFKTLIGHLVILATSEFRTVTVERIFADCHVDQAKLVSTVQFVARLHEDFAKAMRDLGYAPSQDSRAKAVAVLGAQPCALAGPSGVGKTWAMARAAMEAEQSGAVVIWVDRPPNERDRLQAHIAQRIQRARDRTAHANPLAMRSILDMASGSGPALRVCVCLDRFSSPTIAHDLITDPWWSGNGIELIAALPAAEPDAVAFEPGVTLIHVDGFTLGEVRRFLKQRGIDWASIAPEPAVVETQIRALLASELEEVRIRGLTAAGWMATPGLDAAILDVRKADARTAVRRAVRDATSRSDRLGAMMSLAIAAGKAVGETRWRVLALLAEQDENRVLRAHKDPLRLAIGDLDDRDAAILEARLKR